MLRSASLLLLAGAGQVLGSVFRASASAHPHTTVTHSPHYTSSFPSAYDFHASQDLFFWPLRIIRYASIGVVITAAAIPTLTITTLLLTGRGEADAHELLLAVPRTLRVMYWSLWTAYSYKKLATSHFTANGITEETYREELSKLHRKAARRLLKVCQINGGVYVKAGQLAVSMQAVPPEYREGLEGLEDRVPSRPFHVINKALIAELGAPADELFAEFEHEATAAASLAQVHRATLRQPSPLPSTSTCTSGGSTSNNSNSIIKVAVKVQYPGLEAAVAADLTTMMSIASLAYFFFPNNDWRWLFSELHTKLEQELDFSREASNAQRLARCFVDRKDVTVPHVIDDLSTKRVLTMEWVEGAKITDVAAIKRLGLNPRQVGLTFLDAGAEMLCVHGYVHGDMHPGNVMVRARTKRPSNPLVRLLPWCRHARPEIVLLDHGLYFELDDHLRQLYCMLWCAFVLNDASTATDAAVALAGPRAGKALPQVLRPRDWTKVPPEERRRLRQEAGVHGVRDLTKILNEAPGQLVDCLRAMAMVRHTATRLGVTVADRLRVNAVQALHGLQVQVQVGNRRGTYIQYVGVMKSRVKRWRLWVHILAMRVAAWVELVLHLHQTSSGGEGVDDDDEDGN